MSGNVYLVITLIVTKNKIGEKMIYARAKFVVLIETEVPTFRVSLV